MSDQDSDQGDDVVHVMTDFLAPADDDFADEMDASTTSAGDKKVAVVKKPLKPKTKPAKASSKSSKPAKSSTPNTMETSSPKTSTDSKPDTKTNANGKVGASTKKKTVKKKAPSDATKSEGSPAKKRREVKPETPAQENASEKDKNELTEKKEKFKSPKKKSSTSRKYRSDEAAKRKKILDQKEVEVTNVDLNEHGADGDDEQEEGQHEEDFEELTYEDSDEREVRTSKEETPGTGDMEGFDTRSEASSSDNSGSLESDGSSSHHGGSRRKRISPIVYENDRRNKNLEDQQSKLKYLFRGARYFLIKSNNHENVALAKAKGVWATPPINETKLGDAFMSCRHVVLIFSVKESGKFQGYARMRTPPIRDGPIVNWVLPTGLSRAALGGTFQLDWITRQDVSFTKTQHLYNPWNDMKPVKIGRDGQEIESRVGEELCRLFPMDPHIDIVEILREARRRRRDQDSRGSSRPSRDSMRPPRQDYQRIKRSRHSYDRRDDYDRPKRRPPPYNDGHRDMMPSGSSYSDYLRDYHQARHPLPMSLSPYGPPGHPHHNSYPGPMGPPPPHFTQMDRSLHSLPMRDRMRDYPPPPPPMSRRDRDRDRHRDRDRDRGRREHRRDKDRRSGYNSRTHSSAVDDFIRLNHQSMRSRRSRSPLSPPRSRGHRRR
ncbi:YTH domain-containing protein 1-like isoform X2 [Anneissia japonica]|uniref:YTH domain-containing protein 1-like isoform X2 n=1 Tax=Anneissia japonica TaxID=1529436 RepID=UPI0014256F89|nr:YTH domain-containing protein 1-like isoform X2 [Anneissia japonica]